MCVYAQSLTKSIAEDSMKSKNLLAFIMLMFGLPAFCNSPTPVLYSSTLEEVLNKTSAYSWTVKNSQVLLKGYTGALLEEALLEWNNGGNIQKSPKITITGKPSASYENIYFKPCQDLVMELVDEDTHTYQDNFRMKGIVTGEYTDAKGNLKPQILNTNNVSFANFLNAITNKGGNLTLSGTNFIKNKSLTDGGAIYNDSGKVTVNKGSVLMYNLAKGNGGAIYNKGDLVVQNSTVGGQHNEGIYHIMRGAESYSAEEYHIYKNDAVETSDAETPPANINDSGNYNYVIDGYLGSDNWIIIYYLVPEWNDTRKVNWPDDIEGFNHYWVHIYPLGNEAKYGAGIYNEGNATITGTTLKYNIAKADDEGVGGDGGGIYNKGNLTVKKSEFYYNKAVRGGGLYNASGEGNKVEILNSTFTLNQADYGAGAYIKSGDITFKNDTFGAYSTSISNKATNGGAIYNLNGNVNIVSSTFSNNKAEKGGDIYNSGNLSISKTTFGYVPKKIYYFEGVIPYYSIDKGTAYAENTETYVVDPIKYSPISWQEVTYNGGSSAIQGGAIYNKGVISNITSSTFNKTTALEGGAIYNDENGTINLIKSTKFNSSYAKDTDNETPDEALGGAIYNKGSLTLQQSTFNGNYSTDKGGAIFASNGNITDTKSTFSGNYSQAGGAVYVDTNGEATFNSSTFVLNNAYKTVSGTDDTTNDVLTEGGAIYNKGSLTLNSVTFGNKKKKYNYTNQARYGAALYNTSENTDDNTDDTGSTTINTSNVMYQSSVYGAIYNNGTLNSNRTTYSNNKSILGGAIYNDSDGTLNLNGSTFTSNNAVSGGAIYADGTVDFKDIQYTYKKNKKTKTTTEKPVFNKNSVTENGGAVYIVNSAKGTIKNTEFTSNKAYTTTDKTTTDETTGTETTITTPSGAGGAIYVGKPLGEDTTNITGDTSEHVTISSSVFKSNSAGYGGGAIAVESDSELDINDSTFTKNSAYSTITTKIKTKVKSGNKTKTVTTTTKSYQGSGGAIYLETGSTSKLIGNKFTSNYANKGGALFIGSGNVTLTNNIFESNTAKGPKGNYGLGGAIYLNKGITANLTGGNFTKNSAYQGGAIYIDKNGFFNLENTEFVSNSSTSEGGAIYVSTYEKPQTDTTSGNQTTDENANQENDNTTDGTDGESGTGDNTGGEGDTTGDNTGGESGETPSTDPEPEPSTPTMLFKNVTFKKNSSQFGGAILNAGFLDIKESTFVENKVSAYGGAIYNTNTLTVDKSTFDNNASSYGGALFNAGEATITNSKFLNTKNVPHDAGGAIYNGLSLTISNSEFNGNIARAFGGAIINYQISMFYAPSATSTSNTYTSNQAYYGGAFASYSGTFISNNDTFSKNFAMQGGAILNFSTTKIDSGNFESNQAYYGGGLFSQNTTGTTSSGTIQYKATVTINNSTFTKNRGLMYAGGIYLGGTKAKIENTIFNENNAELFGGAILVSTEKDLAQIYSSEFTGNYVNSNGGAIYNAGMIEFNLAEEKESSGDSTQTDDNPSGDDTTTEPSGDNETTDNPSDTGDNSGDSDNQSGNDTPSQGDNDNPEGGEATGNNEETPSEQEEEPVVYTTIKFDKNKADNGGAIYTTKNSSTKGDNLAFTDNTVTCHGGAIHNSGYVELSNVVFTGNTAFSKKIENKGGAIYNNPDTKEETTNPLGLKLTNASFGDNTADLGGAIYSVNNLTISNSTFGTEKTESDDNGHETTTILGNTATNNGGAIYNKGSALIDNTTFNSNKAANGGAIYTDDYTQLGEYIIDNGTIPTDANADYNVETQYNKFISNTATNNGGAIYNTTTLYINGGYFERNIANKNGGAIYNTGLSILINTTFKNNQAETGGAIYHSTKDNTLTVVNSEFRNNTATNGGAVYVAQNSTATFIDTDFLGNVAANKGGAIFIDKNGTVNIYAVNKDVQFSGNFANGISNSIHLNNANIFFTADTNRTIYVNDPISGKGKITTNGDVVIENQAEIVRGSDITIYTENGKLTPKREGSLNGANLSISNTATLNTANGKIGEMKLNSLTANKSNIVLDVDLKKNLTDKISAEKTEGAGLNLSAVHLISNCKAPVTVKIGEGSEVKTMSATKAETDEATYKLKASLDANGNLVATAYGQKAKPCTMAAPEHGYEHGGK